MEINECGKQGKHYHAQNDLSDCLGDELFKYTSHVGIFLCYLQWYAEYTV